MFSVPAVVFCRKHRRHSTCLYKAYFEGWGGVCLGCLGFGLCFLAFECFSVFHVKRGGLAECSVVVRYFTWNIVFES